MDFVKRRLRHIQPFEPVFLFGKSVDTFRSNVVSICTSDVGVYLQLDQVSEIRSLRTDGITKYERPQ